jgi:chorismate mutase
MTQSPPPFSLADLRREIDRIDETMHRLLMERSEIIETLIEVKKTQASGSAFRPGREADQMKRLAERHQGLLPFDTVESIWRVIVSTFTYVQAPYTVHADTSLGDGLMRDTARFHFGFTVPYRTYRNAQEVIDAVAGSAGDLGIFPANPDQTSGSWWIPLSGPDKPKIIARLPFVERADHPAGTPIYVISKPIDDATVREVILYSLTIERWREGLTQALRRHDASIEASAGDENGLSLLVAAPGNVSTETLADALGGLGIGRFEWHEIGSHAARYHRPEQH